MCEVSAFGGCATGGRDHERANHERGGNESEPKLGQTHKRAEAARDRATGNWRERALLVGAARVRFLSQLPASRSLARKRNASRNIAPG